MNLQTKFYVAGVVAAAAYVIHLAVSRGVRPDDNVSYTDFVALLLLALLLERVSIPLPREGELSVSTIIHVVAVLILPPPLSILVGASGVIAGEVVARKPWYRALFNGSQISLSIGIPALVIHADVHDHRFLSPGFGLYDLLPVIVGILGYYAVNTMLIATVIALSSRESPLRIWWANYRSIYLPDIGMTTLGALIAHLWRSDLYWLAFTILPAWIIVQSFRYINSLELQAARLQRLQKVGLELSTSLDAHEILRRLVAFAPPDNSWEMAVALYAEQEDRYIVRVASGDLIRPMVGRTFSYPPIFGTDVSGRFSIDLGAGHVPLVIPFSAGARSIGAFLVVAPERAVPPADLDALSILGGHVAAAIENSRLYRREVEERRRVALLADAGQEFAASLSADRVVTTVATWVVQNFASAAYVAMVDQNGTIVSETLVTTGDESSSAMLRPKVEPKNWDKLGQRRVTIDQNVGARETVDVPLVLGQRIIGLISFVPQSEVSFGGRDFLSALADRAALALENARLFAEVGEVEALRALDQLKTDFLSMVGHELRTPLTILVGYGELLTSTTVPAELMDDMHRACNTAALQLARIVDDLLDFSRVESNRLTLDRQMVDVVGLVRDVVHEMKSAVPQHDLSLCTELESLATLADSQRLRQILYNLLTNASRYSPPGTPIVTAVERSDGLLVVRVIDRGIGIAPENLTRVFDKFYRVDNEATRRARGMGMGLALCQALVEAHGGSIWVESVVGRGSTFTFTLPIVETSILSWPVHGPQSAVTGPARRADAHF
jgi:signal transduction histidine kinase